MQTPALACLTLVFPPALEPGIVEFLLEYEPSLPGFTIVPGEGHGADFSGATAHELVRGKVARRVLTVVVATAALEPLLERLRAQFPNPYVAYWVVPISAFGRLA